jgi:outer membrane protein OmpA-like peptidoglycan-associated protein
MSSKPLFAIAGAIVLLGSVGCTSAWMTVEEHEQKMTQLNEYKNALEKENADLKMRLADYDRLKAELETNGESAKFYADLADSLKKALNGMDVPESDVIVNKSTGTIEFKDGVLFDLGSWKISPKGQKILKALAETQRTNLLKVVGHADKKQIRRPETLKALETDTNMELSCRRATAVMGELLKHGMRESQFASVEGHGTAATEHNGVARCVEIFVVKGAQVAPTSAVKSTKTSKK